MDIVKSQSYSRKTVVSNDKQEYRIAGQYIARGIYFVLLVDYWDYDPRASSYISLDQRDVFEHTRLDGHRQGNSC